MSGVLSGVIASIGGGVSAPVFPGITNYSVNDRTVGASDGVSIDTPDNAIDNSASSTATLTFTAATGSGITYEWQFLTYYRFNGSCGGLSTPLVGSAQTWNGPYGYNDSISGASSNSLTITGRPYLGTSVYHGVAGYWRLKASNAAGATYTHWISMVKFWGTYTYDCNCVDEVCDTCGAYASSDLGDGSGCSW